VSTILDKIVAFKIGEIAARKKAVSISELRERAAAVPPPKDFLGALRNAQQTSHARVGLIAEVKKASPSKGVIREDFDPVSIARIYTGNGAACISVLTDEHFFQGHLDFLRQIRAAVSTPLLRKDFILDEYQIIEARVAGADAVLLIAECLEAKQLIDLHQCIDGLGMTALVELYDEKNIDAVLACHPKLVGVNNRDLNTFEVDLGHSIGIKQKLPAEIMMVSESGIATSAEVRQIADAGIEAILVGESLMRCEDIGAAVRKLLA